MQANDPMIMHLCVSRASHPAHAGHFTPAGDRIDFTGSRSEEKERYGISSIEASRGQRDQSINNMGTYNDMEKKFTVTHLWLLWPNLDGLDSTGMVCRFCLFDPSLSP
jgi:hypothetical protein